MSVRNIFIIPSWYPNKYGLVAGIFIREQAIAIGKLRPGWKVAISLWGQGELTLSPRDPLRCFNSVLDRVRLRKQTRHLLSPNVAEYKKAVLHTSERLLSGNKSAILKANRRNFEAFIRDVGNVDLIHAHVSFPAGWLAMRLKEETGVPYIITEHMSPFPFRRFLNSDGSIKAIVREPLEKADAVVAVSPSAADQISAFGIQKPSVVPNLVDENAFKLSEKRCSDKFAFFTLANMIPQKGIPDLLHGVSLFVKSLDKSKTEELTFRIAGEGPERRRYQALASNLALDPWVTWLGFLPQNKMIEEFENCDCFVLPSRHESFGVVYVQAIACGKPIIATRCGGPEHIVTPENGLLVDTASPPQLAKALHDMFTFRDNYDARLIRQQFLDRFSLPVVVNKIERVYRDVFGDGW